MLCSSSDAGRLRQCHVWKPEAKNVLLPEAVEGWRTYFRRAASLWYNRNKFVSSCFGSVVHFFPRMEKLADEIESSRNNMPHRLGRAKMHGLGRKTARNFHTAQLQGNNRMLGT